MTLPCGCDWISPGTIKMCKLHGYAPELLTAAKFVYERLDRACRSDHTYEPLQITEIYDLAQRLGKLVAKIEAP